MSELSRRLEHLLQRSPWPGPDLHPDHHLTRRRGGTWQVRLTAYKHQQRILIEQSLKTTDVRVARQRRDEIIDAICHEPDAYVMVRGRRRG
jgi:hypothetical protein